MGLAASQARLLLLTSKNNALELRAQMIEEERLLLSQEQETIANEYSEATTNTIYQATVTNSDGSTSKETLTLESLSLSLSGTTVQIRDANGNILCYASSDLEGNVTYYDSDGTEIGDRDDAEDNPTISALNENSFSSYFQNGLKNGTLQLYVYDNSDGTEDAENDADTTKETGAIDSDGDGNIDDEALQYFSRKSLDSLSTVTSRYYTEDDAAAKAEYDAAMAKVNAMDTRLENQLNQVETQKKAVEQEMESVSSLIDSNIERTFQYFS